MWFKLQRDQCISKWDLLTGWNLVKKWLCCPKIRANLRNYYSSFILLDVGSCPNMYLNIYFMKYKTNQYYKGAHNLSREESRKYLWNIYSMLISKRQSTSERESSCPVADFLAQVWPSLPEIAQYSSVVELYNFNILAGVGGNGEGS